MSDKSESRLLPFGHNCIFLSPADGNQSIDREPLAPKITNTRDVLESLQNAKLIKDTKHKICAAATLRVSSKIVSSIGIADK